MPSGRTLNRSMASTGMTETCIRHSHHSRKVQLLEFGRRIGCRRELVFFVNRLSKNLDMPAICVQVDGLLFHPELSAQLRAEQHPRLRIHLRNGSQIGRVKRHVLGHFWVPGVVLHEFLGLLPTDNGVHLRYATVQARHKQALVFELLQILLEGYGKLDSPTIVHAGWVPSLWRFDLAYLTRVFFHFLSPNYPISGHNP